MNEVNETNELVAPQEAGVLAHVDDETLDFLTAPALSRNFLNLCQGMTKECEQTSISPGMFFISNQDKTKSVIVGGMERNAGKLQGVMQIVYLAWRPKAVLFIDGQPFMESYDPASANFNKIITTPEVKKGQGPKVIKPDWGTEVLVYVPEHMINIDQLLTDAKRGLQEEDISAVRKSFANGAICTFYFKGTNRENTFGGPEGRGGLTPGTALELRSTVTEGKSFSWWKTPVMKVVEGQDEAWMNTGRQLATQSLLSAFVNPPVQGGEAIDDSAGGSDTTTPVER